jgi:hypothetical protein
MQLVPWENEDQVVFYSSEKDYPEILEIWADRAGDLYAKLTTPRDLVATVSLGRLEIPQRLKKSGKNFKMEITKWISSQMSGGGPILKYGVGNSFSISFKLNGKPYIHHGKFRI